MSSPSPEETVVAYHERTKHHFNRFAAGPRDLDWASQPNPFRRYSGAPLTRLPLPALAPDLPFWQLYVEGLVEPTPLTIDAISQFLRYALSLTAWKEFNGTKWSLRANPSSGNLHPTEGYVLLPALDGLHQEPALYHYAPFEHGLERRADLDPSAWTAVMAAFAKDSFLVGLSSVHWREAWKYGERAFRYCQHDVGHALGALRYAASALGWKLLLLDRVHAISALLGQGRDADFGQAEREEADLLAVVVQENWGNDRGQYASKVMASQSLASRWYGEANALSAEHCHHWPVIDEVAAATATPAEALDEDFSGLPSEAELFATPIRSGAVDASNVILGRRSAVAMDARTSISAATFFQMLARLLPTRDHQSMPWDAIAWRPRIHLGLFVHRVNDLAPGLYALVRDPQKVESLKKAMRSDFVWQHPPSVPSGLPLYMLEEGDCRELSAQVSCGQAIAGDGAFSLAMIADYMDSLASCGAGVYRKLFWEAGMIGQVLYLEAEAASIRATGIGCYFDDPVHQVFGLSSRDWQSFYHFTVGGPIEDTRLSTLPAYSERLSDFS